MIRKILAAWLMILLLFPAFCLAEKANLNGLFGDPYENVSIPDGVPPAVYNESEEIRRSTEYTLMVYLCGSSLEKTASASKDLMEMVASGFDESRLNVVVLAGGAQRWYLPQISALSTEIYQVGNAGIRPLTSDGKQRNMGDPETLTWFLDYTAQNFPADHYGLILWDHGEGSLVGVCHDTNFREDCLDLEELRTAFQGSAFGKRKLDWIGFDACLMGSAEIAGAVAPYARYMIASEESEPQCGWDYGFLKELNADEAPEATGARLAGLYLAACRDFSPGVYETTKITMSCVDLSGIQEVSRTLAGFISTVEVNGESFPKLSKTRRGMVSFGRNEEDPRYDFDLIDLDSMVRSLSAFGDAGKAEKVADALKACVPVSESSQENCSGLTLYFPFYNKALFSARGDLYSSLGFAGEYVRFVRDFGTRLVGAGASLSTVGPTEMEDMQKDNRTLIHLPLSEQQREETDVAEIVALQQAENGGWRLVASQGAEITPYGSLSGEYVHTNLFVTDEGGNPVCDIPLVYVERDDGLLSIPLRLTGTDGTEYEARLIGSRDFATNRVREEAVWLYDEAIGGYSPRLAVRLADFAKVTYTAEEREKTWYGEAENSALRPFAEWNVLSSKETSWTPEEFGNLRFVRDYLDSASLALAFRITDIYNNVYMSDLVKIRDDASSAGVYLLDYDDNDRIYLDKTGFGVVGERVFFRVKNLADEETKVTVRATELNGEPVSVEEEIWGLGPHDGMEPGEEQITSLSLPLKEGDIIREAHFEIVLADTGDGEIGKVGVDVRYTGK